MNNPTDVEFDGNVFPGTHITGPHWPKVGLYWPKVGTVYYYIHGGLVPKCTRCQQMFDDHMGWWCNGAHTSAYSDKPQGLPAALADPVMGASWVREKDVQLGAIIRGWWDAAFGGKDIVNSKAWYKFVAREPTATPNHVRWLVQDINSEGKLYPDKHVLHIERPGNDFWFLIDGSATPVDTKWPHDCFICGTAKSAYIGATPAAFECRNGCRPGMPHGRAPTGP